MVTSYLKKVGKEKYTHYMKAFKLRRLKGIWTLTAILIYHRHLQHRIPKLIR
ncbi:hypothetical protein HHI36_019455, partial [Cryptolaemus montrouzieri]